MKEEEEEYEEDEGENQMVAMCRNFNNVGQGAFYTESFRGYIIFSEWIITTKKSRSKTNVSNV